jgi:hypothetical protein
MLNLSKNIPPRIQTTRKVDKEQKKKKQKKEDQKDQNQRDQNQENKNKIIDDKELDNDQTKSIPFLDNKPKIVITDINSKNKVGKNSRKNDFLKKIEKTKLTKRDQQKLNHLEQLEIMFFESKETKKKEILRLFINATKKVIL